MRLTYDFTHKETKTRAHGVIFGDPLQVEALLQFFRHQGYIENDGGKPI